MVYPTHHLPIAFFLSLPPPPSLLLLLFTTPPASNFPRTFFPSPQLHCISSPSHLFPIFPASSLSPLYCCQCPSTAYPVGLPATLLTYAYFLFFSALFANIPVQYIPLSPLPVFPVLSLSSFLPSKAVHIMGIFLAALSLTKTVPLWSVHGNTRFQFLIKPPKNSCSGLDSFIHKIFCLPW